jgi:hypothetical protein
MKPIGKKLVSMELDRVDNEEKLSPTEAVPLTANRRYQASLCFKES